MNVLVGDIGGTKTAVGLYRSTGDKDFETLGEHTFKSGAFPSLSAVLEQFLPPLGAPAGNPAVDIAVFSVAGPVHDGVASTTNLPWVLSEAELSAKLSAKVVLINDFAAVAIGVRELPPESLRVLQGAKGDPRAPYAVIGAGTGLGEALALPLEDGSVRVLPSEGGHADFAARNETEWRLFQFILAQHERVSVERVVSGLGLSNLYDFVVSAGLAPDDPQTRERFKLESHGAVISERASVDPAAAQALSLFTSAYGAEAGNLALKVLPYGGVYIAGGIAARLVDQLDWAEFMRAFLTKGRLAPELQAMRVVVVRDLNVGLIGARAHAVALWKRAAH